MGNGAQFHRLNWLGNPGLAGMQSSAGLMVNYLYDLPALEANARRFRHSAVMEGKQEGTGGGGGVGVEEESESLALGPSVVALLKGGCAGSV